MSLTIVYRDPCRPHDNDRGASKRLRRCQSSSDCLSSFRVYRLPLSALYAVSAKQSAFAKTTVRK